MKIYRLIVNKVHLQSKATLRPVSNGDQWPPTILVFIKATQPQHPPWERRGEY